MYRITYEQGNGYRCGCCRQSWTETVDLETEEAVLEWLEELAACQIESQWEDDDDRTIESIEKEIGVDIEDQFKPRQEKIDHIVMERKRAKEKKKEEKSKKEKKNKEAQDKVEYERLKLKFEKS